MKIFLVGGAVRDQLLNYPFTERDWVVVGATPEQMVQQGFRPVGKDFPVFIHPETGEEYALARTERKVAPGYKGFTFHADPNVSLEEDLQRRDLTINAMAKSEDGELIDPYGGKQDLDNKLLRHVSAAFSEDPVRVLRVARFSARYHHLGFTIAPDTIALMQKMVNGGETQHLVAERVWQECTKALAEKNPVIFFQVLSDCGAQADIFPELQNTSLDHALNNLQIICQYTTITEQRFAALCFHQTLETVQSLCQRLATPNHYKTLALQTSQYATGIQQAQHNTANDIITILQQMDVLRKPEHFTQCLNVIAWLQTKTSPKALVHFWQRAANYYRQADPQHFIKQGYSGAELGQVLKQHRTTLITSFLESL